MDKLLHIALWFFTFLAPLNGVLTTIMFLIVVDFITGVYASFKAKKPITSHKIEHTISKFFIYNLVVISAYFIERHIVNEVPFLKIISGFIAVTEIKSILENYNKIYGVNPFKVLISVLKYQGYGSVLNQEENKYKGTKKE